jgi:16S rRNA (guanine966-N2)-methyltransferase
MPEGARVIAGTARGVRLEAPPGSATRPLSDRVKESLFASLESEGALSGGFLDLFAGSGAAGIEALSRGAAHATFVEKDNRACAVIRANIKRGSMSNAEVFCADVGRYLAAGLPSGREPFTAALLDPPYDMPLLVPALERLADGSLGWLSADATVVAKHFWRDDPPESIGILTRPRQKRFGETMLSYYTRKR